MKLADFKELSKANQRVELVRVCQAYKKRYATTGNKVNNALVYQRCLDENKGLEVRYKYCFRIFTNSFVVRSV
jgi:hypothetical protein